MKNPCTLPFSSDPMHDAPRILMTDMGNPSTSSLFVNLSRRLQIELIPISPSNARNNDQIEKANALIERNFESNLFQNWTFKP